MNKLGIVLIYIIIFLALSGGFVFVGPGYRFEISQLNVFGLLLTLILLIRHLQKKSIVAGSVEEKVSNILTWGQINVEKKLKWAVLLSGLVAFTSQLIRHYTFETAFYDMTCVHPALFYPFGPKFFHCSVCRNGTQFAEHLLWSLIPFSLIFQIFKSDVLIFLFKAACLFVPTYFFIKKGPLSERPKFGFWAFILLMLSSPFKANFTWDFREDHFAFALILLSFITLYRGYTLWSFFLIAMIALTKENLPFSTLFYLAPILWAKEIPWAKKKRVIFAGSVAIFSLVYTVLAFKIFIPYFMSGIESQNNILLRFPGMGNTMEEFLSNLVNHPIQFISIFLSRLSIAETAKYLIFIALPFALGYKAWIWTVPAWPQIAANILVDHPTQRMMVHHYEAIILGFLFGALGFSLAKKEITQKKLMWGLLLGLCVAGRGPLVEITRRLFYKGHLIPAAIEMNYWKNIEGPLAADAFTVTHFHEVLDLRVLEIQQHVMPETREERLKDFINMNPRRTIGDQAADGKDAKSFIVNLTLLGGPFIADEFRAMGGEEVRRAKDFYGNDVAILFKMKRNPFEVICERDGFCQKPFKH